MIASAGERWSKLLVYAVEESKGLSKDEDECKENLQDALRALLKAVCDFTCVVFPREVQEGELTLKDIAKTVTQRMNDGFGLDARTDRNLWTRLLGTRSTSSSPRPPPKQQHMTHHHLPRQR